MMKLLFVSNWRMMKTVETNILAERGKRVVEREGEHPQDGATEGTSGMSRGEGEFMMLGRNLHRKGRGLDGPFRSGPCSSKEILSGGGGNHPIVAPATETFIAKVLPEYDRLSGVIERERSSKQGRRQGYYSSSFRQSNIIVRNLAVNMFRPGRRSRWLDIPQLVGGDMEGAFQSVNACIGVVKRFPGICRYRPHILHSVLTVAASSMGINVYDPLRKIYNSILPSNGMAAPPLEEWHGGRFICGPTFCRYDDDDNTVFTRRTQPRRLRAQKSDARKKQRDLAASTPTTSTSGDNSPPTTDEVIGLFDRLDREPTSLVAAGEAVGVGVASTPSVPASQVPPSSSVGLQPAQHRHSVDSAGRGAYPGETSEVMSWTQSENDTFCSGTGVGSDAGATRGDEILRQPTLNPSTDGVHIGLGKGSRTRDKAERWPSQTDNAQVATAGGSDNGLVGDDVWFDVDVDLSGHLDTLVDDVAAFDNNIGLSSGFSGEAWEGVDLHLTDHDFIEAAQVLMSLTLEDEEGTEDPGGYW